jgi:hypothetical protein
VYTATRLVLIYHEALEHRVQSVQSALHKTPLF